MSFRVLCSESVFLDEVFSYLDGIQGLLKTKDGQQLNLDNIGTTPLAEKVKTKACDLVLKQGLNFIS